MLSQHRQTSAHWVFCLCQDTSVLRTHFSSFPTSKANNSMGSFPAGPSSNPVLRIHNWALRLLCKGDSQRKYTFEMFSLILSVYLYVLSCCAYVSLCTTCLPGAYAGQKRALDSLRLELQTIVSWHVDAGIWTLVLWKNISIHIYQDIYTVLGKHF